MVVVDGSCYWLVVGSGGCFFNGGKKKVNVVEVLSQPNCFENAGH